MTQKDKQLAGVLDQSKKIYDLAVAGAWQEVEASESERRKLIDACFSVEDSFSNPEQAAHLIQEIMVLDNKVIELGVNARNELGGALRESQHGRQAINVYRSIGS